MIGIDTRSEAFQVNPPSDGDQVGAVFALPTGGLLGYWHDGALVGTTVVPNGIGLGFLSGQGVKGSGVMLPSLAGGDGPVPDLDALSDGQIVLSFLSYGLTSPPTGVFEVLNPDGTLFAAETTVGAGRNITSFTVEALSSGGFVAVSTFFDTTKPGAGRDVWAEFFGSDGQASAGPVRLNATAKGDQYNAICTALDGSRVLAVWTDWSQFAIPATSPKLVGRIFNADGTPGSHEFIIAAGLDSPAECSISELANGDFVAVWRNTDMSQSATQQFTTSGRVFDANGVAVGAAFQIDAAQMDQGQGSSISAPQVKALPDGRFVVVWSTFSIDQNGNGTGENLVQVFDADGAAASAVYVIGDGSGSPGGLTVDVLADGRIVVSWHQPQGDLGRPDLYAQILDSRDQAITLLGNDLDNQYVGTEFNDVLHGGGGKDFVRGGDGDDFVAGDDGDDKITGNKGNDILTGNQGQDLVLGNRGDDTLSGLVGADTLLGGAGNDTLTGGSDGDRFVFRPGDGADVITDFRDGADVIALGGYNFASFAEAAGHFTAVSTGVQFSFGSDTILIVGLMLADLTSGDLVL